MTRAESQSPPRAVLHIGTEKTGTTTIQRFLGENRESLRKQGILYPTAPANRYHNHVGLSAYGAGDNRFDDIRHHLEITDAESLERYRRSLEQRLHEEIEACHGEIQTIVFSNEHCHSRLVTEAEVRRLADLLEPLVSEVRIVVYLRRQDRMAVSLYSTYLKSGGTERDIFMKEARARRAPYYNFERLLDMWATVFGEAAMEPRIYDRSRLQQGDVIHDFMDLIGMGISGEQRSADYVFPSPMNESFSLIAQEFVRHLNQRVVEDDERLRGRDVGAIISRLTSTYAGPGRRPARDAAIAFQACFSDANERVRERWFPTQSSLFDEDFGNYPEVDDLETLGFADAADLFVDLIDWRPN